MMGRKPNGLDFVTNDKGCFICSSHKPSKRGYIYIWRNAKRFQLHRYIYAEMFGEIPEGKIVRHKCDEPLCFNPEHLELGTHKDNTRDAIERGRIVCGERSYMAILTEENVFEIRRLLAAGMKQTEIGKLFGVRRETISAIKTGRTWRHLFRKEGAKA